MATLVQEHYPLGWLPSDDPVSGRKEGLLRMDNLMLEEKGIVALQRGTQALTGAFPGGINSIYSRQLTNGLQRYVHHGNQVSTSTARAVLTGGAGYGAAFATIWGHVLVASGNQRVRDDGNVAVPLDINAPGPPTLDVNNPENIILNSPTFDNWDGIETNQPGDILLAGPGVDYVQFDLKEDTFRGIAQMAPGVINTLILSGGSKGTDDDIFSFRARCSDTDHVSKIRIEILLKGPGNDVEDYYIKEWDLHDNVVFAETEATPTPAVGQDGTLKGLSLAASFRQGLEVWNTFSCKRSDFGRVGTDDSVGWNTVVGVRIVALGSVAGTVITATELLFIGGDTGPLRGFYKYLAVAVFEDESFIGKSPYGQESQEIQAINAGIRVAPAAIPINANKLWIYRIGGKLDGYYLVKNDSNGDPFNDDISDDDLLRSGDKLSPAVFAAPPDNIIAIVGPVRDRVLYFTQAAVYFSDTNDPCRVNVNFKAEIASSEGEVICFAEKVAEDQVVIATTKGFYLLSGQFLEDPTTGFLDFAINGYDTKFPAVNASHAVDKGIIFYEASDGIRATQGSQTDLLSSELQLLFNGDGRAGFASGLTPSQGLGTPCVNGIAIAHDKLYYVGNFAVEGLRLFVYHFNLKYWTLKVLPGSSFVNTLFTEESGNLLGGGQAASDSILRSIDVGTLFDFTQNQGFSFINIYHDGGAPKRRKDAYTLKIIADTGNTSVDISVDSYSDSGSVVTYSTSAAFNGRAEKSFDLYNVLSVCKYFRIRISGTVPVFKLYLTSIEYEPRPEQISSIRIKATNLGTAKRKKFLGVPYVIDSLGNNLDITPIIDGSVQTASSNSSTGKRTLFHWFTTDVTGIDCELVIKCTDASKVFEFYELPERDAVYEVLPLATKFMRINDQNWGTAARKRFSRLAFIVDPRGGTINFTPVLDGIDSPTVVLGTGNRKQTLSYYYTGDKTPVDIGAKLSSSQEFEFYDMLKPEILEILPEPVKYLKPPTTNYGVAAKKRVRTIAFNIDTRGSDITYTPTIDGVDFPPATFNTNRKQTVFYYFESDMFGIDVGGTFTGVNPFEFYGFENPATVEVLPMGKKLDQLGPLEFNRAGRVRMIRVRMICEGASMSYRLYGQDLEIDSGTFVTAPDKEKVYELSLIKGISATICRLELQASSPFYRINAEFKVDVGNQGTDWKLVKVS